MRIITSHHIHALGISPAVCVDWVRESFLMKKQSQLPAKISVHPCGEDFITSMPCLLPAVPGEECQYFSVKVVHRIESAVPSLGSDILLYNARNGELLALLDGDWITAMRTGAVAALATQMFRNTDDVHAYGFLGLGNTARATLLCLLDSEPDLDHHVRLLRYKDQAELFIQRFGKYKNVSFEIVSSACELIATSAVVFSCVTSASGLICPDNSVYPEGQILIPVHTRGFQNCDLFFDRVVADDTAHVCKFRYFDHFHNFCEMTDVLDGTSPGRQSPEERILCYNIGLGLHDAVFASRIYSKLKLDVEDIPIQRELRKFWV